MKYINLIFFILVFLGTSLSNVVIKSDSFIKYLNFGLTNDSLHILKAFYTTRKLCFLECLADSSCCFVDFKNQICQLNNKNAILNKTASNQTIFYIKRSKAIISSINNPYGVNWGVWGPSEECDQNDYVIGFRTKLHPAQMGNIDDTALNGVELICSNGKRLKSSEGQLGSWGSNFRNCSSGQKVNGFSYGMEQKQDSGDDSATNVIRLKCTGNSTIQSLEGPWSTSIIPISCLYGVIVGLRTQVDQNSIDNTALNNIEFTCKLI